MKLNSSGWPSFLVVSFIALVFLPGCGNGQIPVHGQVTYEDGSPVEEGTVLGTAVIDSKEFQTQGNLGKGGVFDWGTTRPGDGAFPGIYKVIVIPKTLSEAESSKGVLPAVHKKYANYETSGITFEVKGQGNVLNIKVSKGGVENN